MSASAMRSYEIISAMPNRFICSMQGGLNASRPPCPRDVSARTCSLITLKVHRETVPADGRQAFQRLLTKCVPIRESCNWRYKTSCFADERQPKRMPAPVMRIYESISAMPNRFICSRQGGLNASRPPCPALYPRRQSYDWRTNNDTLSRTQRY